MAQVTNNFLKGKMNKDLDARLLQPGEYRNAVNAQVSKSEGPNVGALENVLGNALLIDWNTYLNDGTVRDLNLKSIGYLTDEINNTMYIFLTNNQLEEYVSSAKNYIVSYDTLANQPAVLVEGAFLNFSQLYPIYGVNILEGLLFFTDNRNQPRKINTGRQLGYYTTEDQISVAKYNPYQAIEFWRNTGVVDEYETTMKNVSSKFYPNGGEATGIWNGDIVNSVITIDTTTINGDIPIGGRVGYIEEPSGALVKIPSCRVVSAVIDNTTPNSAIITVDSNTIPASPTTPTSDVTWVFSYNPYYEHDFSGDSEFLKDKFARFSYRFQFDDNEYSIFAPFTQPMFIPEQDGYFMKNRDFGQAFENVQDEEDTYRSTIVEFMENKVTQTELRIPLPYNKSSIGEDLKITSIDILYKESNALAVKIVDTIPIANITAQSGDQTIFTYNYNSKKPYKTLPSDEITRVFDKVPVKALAQEISANRVIYGNFQTKHSPPPSLNYNVRVAEKSFEIIPVTATVSAASTGTTITISAQTGIINVGDEYVQLLVRPNPTVVSVSANTIVLNSAISVTPGQVLTFTGSELLNPSNTVSKIEYPSSTLKQDRTYQVGVVLADRFGRQSTVILSELDSTVNVADYSGSTIFSDYLNSSVSQAQFPGNVLQVLFNNPISVPSPPIEGWPGIYNGDSSSADYNPLGWYSYKIVVKQQEQEYYNVYLPGVMAAYPEDSTLEIGKTSHTVLINDNINKVPRDLNEVGPTQKQFRSSVQLKGRVENQNSGDTSGSLWNKPYFPTREGSTVSTIASNNDLFNGDAVAEYIPSQEFYSIDSDPFIARISTTKLFGVTEENTTAAVNGAVSDLITIVVDNIINGSINTGDRINGTGILPGTVVNNFDSGSSTITVNKKQTLFDNTELTFFSSQPVENVQRLAVFETYPVLSELDIFWETTTSGLITDLNTIIAQDSSSASNLNGFNAVNFDEAIVPGISGVSAPSIGTGAFQLVDDFGQPILYADGRLTLTGVVDENGNDRSSEFQFETIDDVNGTYNINVQGSALHPFYVYSTPLEDIQFIFSFTSTPYISGVAQTSGVVNFEENVNLLNLPPVITPETGTCPISINVNNDNGNPYGIIATLYGVNGSAYGINKTEGLEWTLTAPPTNDGQVYFQMSAPIDVLDYPTAGITSSKVIITVNPNVIGGVPNRTYDLRVSLKDAGNTEVACFITVTVNNVVCTTYSGQLPDEDFGLDNPAPLTLTYTNCDTGVVENITGLFTDGTIVTECSQGPLNWSYVNPVTTNTITGSISTLAAVQNCDGQDGGGTAGPIQ